MSDQTRDPKTPRDFVDPAAWLYLPEAVARELHECARSNGRIDIDYLVAIYRCGREAARAADAQTIATLRAEVERSGDALAIERGLVTIYRNDVERHAQTIATLQDENARLKAGRDSAEDELDTLKRQRDKAYADSAGLLLERNALRGENARLKAERDDAASWADLVTRGKGLCGHWKCYTYTEDPKGVRLDCLQCRAERVEAELATLKADADRREQEVLRALGALFDAVYALRADFCMKYPALSEALFAARSVLTHGRSSLKPLLTEADDSSMELPGKEIVLAWLGGFGFGLVVMRWLVM